MSAALSMRPQSDELSRTQPFTLLLSSTRVLLFSWWLAWAISAQRGMGWCIPAGGYWRLAVGVPPVLPGAPHLPSLTRRPGHLTSPSDHLPPRQPGKAHGDISPHESLYARRHFLHLFPHSTRPTITPAIPSLALIQRHIPTFATLVASPILEVHYLPLESMQ